LLKTSPGFESDTPPKERLVQHRGGRASSEFQSPYGNVLLEIKHFPVFEIGAFQ